MICPKCKTEKIGRFCKECGSKLVDEIIEENTCPKCGKSVVGDFCNCCGVNISTESLENDVHEMSIEKKYLTESEAKVKKIPIKYIAIGGLLFIIALIICIKVATRCTHEYEAEIVKTATLKDPTIVTNYTCVKCGDHYDETTQKDMPSIAELDEIISNLEYYDEGIYYDFGTVPLEKITVGQLVNLSMSDYELIWKTYDDTDPNGFERIYICDYEENGIDTDNVYFATISGEVYQALGYQVTNYVDHAFIVGLCFDDAGNLVKSRICTGYGAEAIVRQILIALSGY